MTLIHASRHLLTAVLAAAICTAAATLAVAQTAAPQAEAPDEPGNVDNSIGFSFESPAQRAARAAAQRTQALEQIARLRDPQQRAGLREGARADVRRLYPELAQVLGIDADLEEKLVTLLAEQGLEGQLRASEHLLAYLDGQLDANDGSRRVAVLDRERGAVKALLGPRLFDRYLDYLNTLLERRRVLDFDARLGDERMTRQQKDQLMALLMEREGERLRQRSDNSFESLSPGPAALAPYDLLANIRLQERIIASETQLQAQLLTASSQFLNDVQQAAFVQQEQQRLLGTRKYLRVLRQRAGLN